MCHVYRNYFAGREVGDEVQPSWLDYNSFRIVEMTEEEVTIYRIGRSYSLTYNLNGGN